MVFNKDIGTFVTRGLSTIGLVAVLGTSAYALEPSKVLTSSAEEYAQSEGKELSTFTLYGLRASGTELHSAMSDKFQCFYKLIEEAPPDTEAIVDYDQNSVNYGIECYGTALVPKN